jgi:hypothetical protein
VSDSFFDDNSRLDKFNKRRKNTKLINVLIVLGALLGIFLLFLMFTKDDDQPVEQAQSSNEEVPNEDSQQPGLEDGESDNTDNQDAQEGEEEEENAESDEPDSTQNDDEGSNDESSNGQVDEASDDPNVLETIVKDWEPIGTVQEEPHVATYDDSTVDWKEMWEAARYATNLTEDDYIEWRAANNGNHNKAKLTISNKAQTETYRVYIDWIENEGWKPIKVEVLKENDIKKMYEENHSGGE